MCDEKKKILSVEMSIKAEKVHSIRYEPVNKPEPTGQGDYYLPKKPLVGGRAPSRIQLVIISLDEDYDAATGTSK